jgi:hypothetical protein
LSSALKYLQQHQKFEKSAAKKGAKESAHALGAAEKRVALDASLADSGCIAKTKE